MTNRTKTIIANCSENIIRYYNMGYSIKLIMCMLATYRSYLGNKNEKKAAIEYVILKYLLEQQGKSGNIETK